MIIELARSKVTPQEQTSVPAEVRRRFGIKSGSELCWLEEGGRLFVDLARPHTLEDVRAVLKGPAALDPTPDLKSGIKAHLAAKFKRARR